MTRSHAFGVGCVSGVARDCLPLLAVIVLACSPSAPIDDIDAGADGSTETGMGLDTTVSSSSSSTAEPSTGGTSVASTSEDTESSGSTSATSDSAETGTQASCDPVEFVDPNLEAAVRSALDILDGPILAADIDSLSGLSTQDEPVHSLSGLECAINLEMLIVAEGNTASLEPLGSLPKLRHLALKGKIVDISPLADLTALRFLWLGENEIVDIEALTDLTSLTRLYLQSNNITDIGPLAGLTKLTRLSLRNNAIVDIGPLAALENVEELRISNNAIEDVSALEGMTALRQLHAEENLVSDISPIGAMTLLRFTYLQGNQISELDGLLGGAWEQEGGPDCADLHLEDNPLSETAITVTAPEVCEKLEVRITWDVPDGTCGWGFTCAIP